MPVRTAPPDPVSLGSANPRLARACHRRQTGTRVQRVQNNQAGRGRARQAGPTATTHCTGQQARARQRDHVPEPIRDVVLGRAHVNHKGAPVPPSRRPAKRGPAQPGTAATRHRTSLPRHPSTPSASEDRLPPRKAHRAGRRGDLLCQKSRKGRENQRMHCPHAWARANKGQNPLDSIAEHSRF